MIASTLPFRSVGKSQMVATVLVALAYLAERPYVFLRYPGYLEQSSLAKIAALMLFIFAFWLLCLLLYVYAARSRTMVKWTIFVLLAISSTAFDTYSAVSNGAPLLYADFAVLADAAGSGKDAFLEYYPLLAYSSARLAVLFLAFVLMKPERHAEIKAIALLSASTIAFAGICVIKHGTYTNLLPGTTGLYGLGIASAFDNSGGKYIYSDGAAPTRVVHDLNIVLVIDESVRADFMTGSDLLPIAAHYSGGWRHYDFGVATSAGNCSASSNIMIRKGVRPMRITEDLYSRPLIWSHARNAGFRTYLIDAQRGGKGHLHFDSVELGLVNHNLDASSLASDGEIPELMEYLADPGKTLTMIVMRGSHFPYHRNFPADYAPPIQSSYVLQDPMRVSYAKSIGWQTGRFLQRLTSMQLSKPTVVIYTSDHGQNLNDQPGPHHCTVSGTPFEGEGLVPLIVFANHDDPALEAARQFNGNKLSHFNIFPTVAAYMGFDVSSDDDDPLQPQPLFRPVQALDRFSYGDAFGRFGQHVQFMDIAGRKEVVLQRLADAAVAARR